MEIVGEVIRRKGSDDPREADLIAIIRSIVVLVNFITCFFIISEVIHHW